MIHQGMYRIHYELTTKNPRITRWHVGISTTGGMSPEQWKEFVAMLRASSAPLVTSGRLLRIGYEPYPQDGSFPTREPAIFARINFPRPS